MSLERQTLSRISRRALAPVNSIARRATSRSVLPNTSFTHHRTLRQWPLSAKRFRCTMAAALSAKRFRCTKAAALPQHSISAPVNSIARRATSRSVLLNASFTHHQTLRQCPISENLRRQASSLHESCGFAAALHKRGRCPAGNWVTGASALRLGQSHVLRKALGAIILKAAVHARIDFDWPNDHHGIRRLR